MSPRERGQASIELIGLLPVLVLVVLAAAQALAAGSARELAHGAAAAGALAIAQDRDPAGAARAAIPDVPGRRLSIRVEGRSVTVVVRPRTVVPGAAPLLRARARAWAGPE